MTNSTVVACVCDCKRFVDAIFCFVFLLIPLSVAITSAIFYYQLIYKPKQNRKNTEQMNVEDEMVSLQGQERQSEEEKGKRRRIGELVETVFRKKQKNNEVENKLLSEEIIDQEKTKVLVDEQKKQIEDLEKEIKRRAKIIEKHETTIRQMRKRILDLQDQIKVHRNPSEHLDYAERPSLIRSILTLAGSSEAKKPVNGLAVIDQSLFVLHSTSSEIEVYDTTTFDLTGQFPVPMVTDPLDMTSCAGTSCIFVLGRVDPSGKSSRIVRMESGDGSLILDWSSGGNSGRLSAHETSVVVCLFERMVVCEFSDRGRLLHTVRLSPDACLSNPLHAVKVNDFHVLLSHGHSREDHHRVCLLSVEGAGGGGGGEDEGASVLGDCSDLRKRRLLPDDRFDCPVSVLEGRRGSVLVADRGNRRVVLLNSSLKYERILLEAERGPFTDDDSIPKDAFPERLCFDETGQRLIVGVNASSSDGRWEDGRILVFDLR